MIRCGIYDNFFRPDDPSITWKQPCPSFWEWVDNCDDPARVDVVMATYGSGYKLGRSAHQRRILYLQETRVARPHPSYEDMVHFDLVLSNDRELVQSLPNAMWTSLFGIRMKPEHYAVVPVKTRNVSLMGSSLQGPAPGHILRWLVHRRVSGIDSFGFNGRTYWKRDSLADYRYQIAIESARYDAWVTEKLWDCFALRTIPIYWGGITSGHLRDLGFDPAGVIWWDGDLGQLREIVDFINRQPDTIYNLAHDTLAHNRQKVLEIPSGEYSLANVLTFRWLDLVV
jgi:hypothetical protein